jgi:hypothetical protein
LARTRRLSHEPACSKGSGARSESSRGGACVGYSEGSVIRASKEGRCETLSDGVEAPCMRVDLSCTGVGPCSPTGTVKAMACVPSAASRCSTLTSPG